MEQRPKCKVVRLARAKDYCKGKDFAIAVENIKVGDTVVIEYKSITIVEKI